MLLLDVWFVMFLLRLKIIKQLHFHRLLLLLLVPPLLLLQLLLLMLLLLHSPLRTWNLALHGDTWGRSSC